MSVGSSVVVPKRNRVTAGRWMASKKSSAMSGSIATGVIGQLLLLASGVVVARALGPGNRGVLGLVVVLSALATQLGSLGLPVAVTYSIASAKTTPSALLLGLRSFLRAQLVVTVLAHAALVLIVLWPRSPSGFLWVGLVSVAATAATMSQTYGLAVLQGSDRFFAFNVARILNGALYVLGVSALWLVNAATLTSIALTVVAASIVAAAVTWIIVIHGLGEHGHRKVDTRELVSFGLRSFLGASPPLETFRLDQLFVALALSPLALGYFIVGLAFTNLTRFIGQSIGMVTYPNVAGASDRRSQLRIIRRDFILAATVCGGLTLALVGAIPRLVPFFFGTDFEPATRTAQILLVATFVASIRRVLVDGTRGAGWPLWGATAESLTLLGLPVVLLVALHTDSLDAVALVFAGANAIGLLVIAPALAGFRYDSEPPDEPLAEGLDGQALPATSNARLVAASAAVAATEQGNQRYWRESPPAAAEEGPTTGSAR